MPSSSSSSSWLFGSSYPSYSSLAAPSDYNARSPSPFSLDYSPCGSSIQPVPPPPGEYDFLPYLSDSSSLDSTSCISPSELFSPVGTATSDGQSPFPTSSRRRSPSFPASFQFASGGGGGADRSRPGQQQQQQQQPSSYSSSPYATSPRNYPSPRQPDSYYGSAGYSGYSSTGSGGSQQQQVTSPSSRRRDTNPNVALLEDYPPVRFPPEPYSGPSPFAVEDRCVFKVILSFGFSCN
jgi:hypothetical protein